MVIIDPQDGKSPRGPRPVPQIPLGPPPYIPLSPNNPGHGLPSPPPRSPGFRPPPSPYSAPPSNFLTIKRDKADITGSWHINTALPPPPSSLGRTLSVGSDRESDIDAASEAGTNTGTDLSDPSSSAVPGSVSSVATSASLNGSAARPNLKLFSPRGKIDATIRVSGGPRAWIETISREEDVAVTFPPNPTGAPRAPIKLLVRSTAGNVHVHLPAAFKGTLRVPSDTVLPQSMRSQSVVLSPSEPPIDRPPILDEVSTKPKLGMGSIPSRAATPTPPSPPPSVATPGPAVAEGQTPQSPVIVSPAAPASPPPPTLVPTPTSSEPGSQSEAQQITPAGPSRSSTGNIAPERPTILEQPPVETPAQEIPPPLVPATSTTPTPSSPPPTTAATPPPTTIVTPPMSPPALSLSPSSTLAVPTTSTTIPTPTTGHRRTFSSSSSHLPLAPAPAHDTSESSTVYFIGDLLHSGYSTNTPDRWEGDEFVLDSEHGRVRVWMYGEKAEVPWTEDVAGKMKDVMDWGKWKSAAAATGELVTAGGGKGGATRGNMQLNMPKLSMSGMARKFKFGK